MGIVVEFYYGRSEVHHLEGGRWIHVVVSDAAFLRDGMEASDNGSIWWRDGLVGLDAERICDIAAQMSWLHAGRWTLVEAAFMVDLDDAGRQRVEDLLGAGLDALPTGERECSANVHRSYERVDPPVRRDGCIGSADAMDDWWSAVCAEAAMPLGRAGDQVLPVMRCGSQG